ncbi:hypothetical protein NPIL_7281 [Nephila pilipes]|uniref:Uncharacterized protein n=1 Tax=Nephila pilipes TaxID=299642 RepID=A0A8X6TXM8_NEPPI|nr:hypothetical protein NPIL_7281 [Nephila pilipes]
MGCMTCGTVLLKPHVVHISIIQFRQKNCVIVSRYRAPVTFAARPATFSKKVWSNDASSPKSAPNSNMLSMHLFLDNHVRVQ